MEQKTKIIALDDKQELKIVREFDLPVELLFKAYSDQNLFEQWMGTKVIKFECKELGYYQFETFHEGSVVFRAKGTIHEFIPNQRITRTFKMENSELPVQLEFLGFEELSEDASQLTMHIVFKSVESRNKLMQMPFEYGLNLAHNRLQEILKN